MKVRVVISYDFNDQVRKAVNNRYGDPGLASRERLKRLIRDYGEPPNDCWKTMLDEGGSNDVGLFGSPANEDEDWEHETLGDA